MQIVHIKMLIKYNTSGGRAQGDKSRRAAAASETHWVSRHFIATDIFPHIYFLAAASEWNITKGTADAVTISEPASSPFQILQSPRDKWPAAPFVNADENVS